MGEGELRRLAEVARWPMTCGGHQSTGSLLRCAECKERDNASWALSSALSPDVVLRLLDERDAAVAALARVRLVADGRSADGKWLFSGDSRVRSLEARLRDALTGPESDAGGEVAPAGSEGPNGVQNTVSDDDLREAIGRAKKAAETRAGDS